MKGAFGQLVEMVPSSGTLLVSNQYEAAKEVVGAAHCPVVYYGGGEPTGWVAKDVRVERGRVRFAPNYKGTDHGTVAISLFGRHNVDNALGVYAMARELGLKPNIIRKAMTTFAGVRRRQEIKGEVGGVILIDDFAHHPTAVRETIAGVRMSYPGRRLWAIFEPRSQTSRRRIFETEFAEALAAADRVVVAGLYQPEKIPEKERLSPEAVVAVIGRLCGDGRAVTIEKADQIATHVAQQSQSGDIILVMSNGGFDKVQHKILNLLKERRLP
jgi:UDP-N-acetylmuramate: L-alanyl-gamma-D-glutamyl-meso-diaminopimelate ligase